jgi:hypothetical protein
MPTVSWAIAAALGVATAGFDVLLAFLGFPLYVLVVVALALIATEILLVDWHPVAILASVLVYVAAAAIGLIGFTLWGFAAQLL